jgi:uncharacterized cupredoxin-like copper-binding protein
MRTLYRNVLLLFVSVAVVVTWLSISPVATAGTAQATRADAATTVRVRTGELFFRLSKKTVPRPGRVTFVVTNGGHAAHDFRINGRKTPLIRPGRTARLTVTFRKKGRYPFVCTVPGHAAAGMRGVFTVR